MNSTSSQIFVEMRKKVDGDLTISHADFCFNTSNTKAVIRPLMPLNMRKSVRVHPSKESREDSKKISGNAAMYTPVAGVHAMSRVPCPTRRG